MMAKIQALKKTEYVSHFVYLPRDVLEEAGIVKGDSVSIVCESTGKIVMVKE